MPKAYIAIDINTGRVAGHRAGSFFPETPEPNEIEVPLDGFDYNNYVFKKYDAQTQQFISDADTVRMLAEVAAQTTTQSLYITPLQFKQLFTLQERVAIKTLQQQDILVQEFNSILDDPNNLTFGLRSGDTQTYLDYLVTKQILNSARKQQVLDNIKP